MKINMTQSESVKSFEDIEHHLVLENKHRDTSKVTDQAFLAKSARTSNPMKNKKKQNMEEKGV